ncbi:hypothetical protein Tco_1043607 [Tanacetum coccineum]|uniref:Uncharacterized protein n=1 Tax=Tanacetum coccineum TaxID=301880 RepID=A0ABQ5GPQ2_9ASTR
MPLYKSTTPYTRVSKEQVNTARVNGVNTAGQKAVSAVEGNGITVVKASACCVWRPKMTDLNNFSKDNTGSWISKRVNYIDPQGRLNGCSRHMTGNKALLTDYQDIDGGFVAFGGNTRVLVVHHTTNGHQFTMSNRQERIGYSMANGNCTYIRTLLRTSIHMAHMEFYEKHNMVASLQNQQEFWQTATIETVNDGEQQITVTVDGQTIAITEATVMRHL